MTKSLSGAAKPLPIVGVMGSSEHAHADLAEPLGAYLGTLPVHLLTGAGPAAMEAVARAFTAVPDRVGLSIGIVPADSIDKPTQRPEGYPNRYIELPIHTHLVRKQPTLWDGLTRNHVNILTSTAVIALPGSHGTAHEITMATTYGKPTAAFLHRADEMSPLPPTVKICLTMGEVQDFLKEALDLYL